MVSRINFLEKGKYILTYKKMMILVVGWIVICFSLFIIEKGYSWWVEKKLEKEKQVMQQLNARKDKTMALLQAQEKRPVETEVKKLSEVYEHFPVWSEILDSLALRIPSQVWLKSLTSSYVSGSNMFRKLEIGGMGQNAALIASFVKSLNDTEVFKNVIMNKTKREEGEKAYGYSFVILGEIVFGQKEWD